MGCVSSKPLAGPRENLEDVLDESETSYGSSKASTTRARRLSIETKKGNQCTIQGAPHSPDLQELTLKAGAVAEIRPSSNANPSPSTRGRRLSYVTNDKELADKIKAEYAMYEEAPQAVVAATGGLQAPSDRPVNVQVACMSRAGKEPGYRKTNQDNCFAFEKYIAEDQSLFGAMDGHGPQGHLVSGFVKSNLPILLVNHITTSADLRTAFVQGFLEVDQGLAESKIDCEFSGSTCTVAYLKGRTLNVAWVGDSRGVVGKYTKKGWEAVDITVDHKPTLPEERARILASQGRVERLTDEMGQFMGPHRVWLQYAWIPGLAMSRALGDQLAHQVGVSSEPGTVSLELEPCHKLIILASDGVWEFISSKEAVEIVAKAASPEEGCRLLVDEAYRRWLSEEDGVVDDITAVIVKLTYP